MKKIKITPKWALILAGVIIIALVSVWVLNDLSINKINIMLFTVCVILGWAMMTLFDIDIAGNKTITDREKWKHAKGGIKPMIKWPIIVIRSLLLLIACLLINHVAPDIYAKLIGN